MPSVNGFNNFNPKSQNGLSTPNNISKADAAAKLRSLLISPAPASYQAPELFGLGQRSSTTPIQSSFLAPTPAPTPVKNKSKFQITPGMATSVSLLTPFLGPLALLSFLPGVNRITNSFGNTVNNGLKSTFNFFKDTFKSILGQDQFRDLKHYVRQTTDKNAKETPQRIPQNDQKELVETIKRDTRDPSEVSATRSVPQAEPRSFLNRVGSGIQNFGNSVFDTIGSGFSAIGSGLSSVGSAIGSGVKAVGGAVGGFFKGLFGGSSSKQELAT